jgi:hypothetical protein
VAAGAIKPPGKSFAFPADRLEPTRINERRLPCENRSRPTRRAIASEPRLSVDAPLGNLIDRRDFGFSTVPNCLIGTGNPTGHRYSRPTHPEFLS